MFVLDFEIKTGVSLGVVETIEVRVVKSSAAADFSEVQYLNRCVGIFFAAVLLQFCGHRNKCQPIS